MNQIHHCLQGRGAGRRSLMHQCVCVWVGGGVVGALYGYAVSRPPHSLHENCNDFIIARVLWAKVRSTLWKREQRCSFGNADPASLSQPELYMNYI